MKRFVLCAVFSLGIFLMPVEHYTQAAGLAELAGCSGTDCSMCNIADLTNGIIKWLIGFLFILFAVIVAYAGFGLVTSGGNSHALDEAKGRFTNAFIGLIIVLAAWLIVDTIMRGLVGRPGAEGRVIGQGEATGWLFWSEVQCYEQSETTSKEYIPEIFTPREMDEFLIDQGTGNNGTITVNTPAGPQVVDARACDESQMGTTNFLGSSVVVNRQFIPSLQRIDARWRQMGGHSFYRVTSVGGYKCRKIAGSSRYSNHAYGVAIDINPARNPHCPSWPACNGKNVVITDMPPAFRQLFLNEGWGWGGNWNSSKDTMHFSKANGEGGNMRP